MIRKKNKVSKKMQISMLVTLISFTLLFPSQLAVNVSGVTGVPNMVYPIHGQDFTVTRQFTFEWDGTSDSAGFCTDYQIQVSTDPNFLSLEIDQTTGIETYYSYYLSTQLEDNIYYWKVRGFGFFEGWGEWSDPWNFTIAIIPPRAPVLLSPEHNGYVNTNMPEYSWEASETEILGQYVSHYHIQISDSNNFTELIEDGAVTSTYFYPEIGLDEGDTWWRVRPVGFLGTVGAWSSVNNFTVDTERPASPVLVSPTNDHLTDDNSTILEWGTVSGAKEYNVQVSSSEFFSPTFYNETTASTNFTLPTELSDYNYFWRVRAIDYAANIGYWSSTWSFTVDTLPPEIGVISYLPANPTERDEIILFCEVWDLGGIDTVTLYYREVTSGIWLEEIASPYFDDVYTATIGPFEADTTIEYYFICTDLIGLGSDSPREEVETGSYSDIWTVPPTSTSKTEFPMISIYLLLSGIFIVLTIFRISKRKKSGSKEIS